MGHSPKIWANPVEIIQQKQPYNPTMIFSPSLLRQRARQFQQGFPGLTTYAVKTNPSPIVIENLAAAGITAFDVASPGEMQLIRDIVPDGVLHYNNPVRSTDEIATAVQMNAASYSVDSHSELDKLIAQVPPARHEISVRFKLPVHGAAYDFGAKFGAGEEPAAALLQQVAKAGYAPALTFHPGTQCTDPAIWDSYLQAGARIAQKAGVTLARLNVGGGFPNHRLNEVQPDLEAIFQMIDRASTRAFGGQRPLLVCEPGRGLCGDAFSHLVKVKAVRHDSHIFINDGTYGALAEFLLVGAINRIEAFDEHGKKRTGPLHPTIIFGPTCDSVDRIPGDIMMPNDIVEGDYLLIHGMGAYSIATNTQFNGFGQLSIETALSLQTI